MSAFVLSENERRGTSSWLDLDTVSGSKTLSGIVRSFSRALRGNTELLFIIREMCHCVSFLPHPCVPLLSSHPFKVPVWTRPGARGGLGEVVTCGGPEAGEHLELSRRFTCPLSFACDLVGADAHLPALALQPPL